MRDVQMPIAIDDIIIPNGRREIDPAVVKRLADSIENVGLRHPITVRRRGEQYILVAGRHRIEACRKLGREHVPACIVSMTNAEARMWEIAENLHRAELTKLDRSNQIAEWVKLCEEVRKVSAPSGGRQPSEQGKRAAAAELGVDEKAVRDAVKIASISSEAQEAATEAGIDDNQSKLLKVAREKPEQQVAKVQELADRSVNANNTTPVSWRVLAKDTEGGTWSNGVRLATKEEASRYLSWPPDELKDVATLVEVRAVSSSDEANVQLERTKKGRVLNRLLFAHGQCVLLDWHRDPARDE
jgi:ParB/RepB/Spo0J family partition protein